MSTDAHDPPYGPWKPFDLLPDLVVVCRGNRICWVNAAAQDLLGWPVRPEGAFVDLPDDHITFELTLTASDGHPVDVEARWTSVVGEDGVVVVVARPITDRRLQAAAQRAIARFIVSATTLSSSSGARSHDIELELGRLLGDYTEHFEFDRVELIDQVGRLALSAEDGMIELDGGDPVPTAWPPVIADDDDRHHHLARLDRLADDDPQGPWASACAMGYRSASRLMVGAGAGEVRFFHREHRPLIDQVEFHALFAEVILSALHSGREVGRLRFAAAHDALTGLPNRVGFRSGIDQMLGADDTSVLFVDLDGFKAINDELGHQIGDAVLVEVARRLRQQLRPGDLAARLGGDEFAVAVGTTVPEHLEALRLRLAAAIEVPMTIGPHLVEVGASIGYAIPQPDHSVDDLLAAANGAMYVEKKSRKIRAG